MANSSSNLQSFWTDDLSNWFSCDRVIGCCLFVFGTFGNIIIFLIFNKSSIKSTTFYLRILLLFESLAYASSFFYKMLDIKRMIINFQMIGIWIMCFIFPYTIRVFQQISAILFCLMMVNKCFYIVSPTKAKAIFTKNKNVLYILLTIFLSFGGYLTLCFNTVFYSSSEFDYWKGGDDICQHMEMFRDRRQSQASLINQTVFAIVLPILIMVITNCVLMKTIISEEYMLNFDELSRNMLFFIILKSRYFAITGFVMAFFSFYFIQNYLSTRDRDIMNNFNIVCYYLYNANFTFNLLMFCLSGKIFRQKLIELFRKSNRNSRTSDILLTNTAENNQEFCTSISNVNCVVKENLIKIK